MVLNLLIANNFNFGKDGGLKNGIVIQISRDVFNNGEFEEKSIYVHDENDENWKIDYVFRFRTEELPDIMLGQPVRFSVERSGKYLSFNGGEFIPYKVEKKRN